MGRGAARVIACASSEDKLAVCREHGADATINYAAEDLRERIQALTEKRGVDVVYDSGGRDTFDRSLNVLRPRGMLVLFGQSSGAVEPLAPQVLNARGSLYLTRPSLGDYTATREEMTWRAGELFAGIRQGWLKVRIDRALPLAQAGAAHEALNSRATIGKVLLLP